MVRQKMLDLYGLQVIDLADVAFAMEVLHKLVNHIVVPITVLRATIHQDSGRLRRAPDPYHDPRTLPCNSSFSLWYSVVSPSSR